MLFDCKVLFKSLANTLGLVFIELVNLVYFFNYVPLKLARRVQKRSKRTRISFTVAPTDRNNFGKSAIPQICHGIRKYCGFLEWACLCVWGGG